MPEMIRLLKISQNTAYRVRKELLKTYHEQKSLREEQCGLCNRGDFFQSPILEFHKIYLFVKPIWDMEKGSLEESIRARLMLLSAP